MMKYHIDNGMRLNICDFEKVCSFRNTMSRRTTPTKSRSRTAPVCEDVPGEFCKRVLSLMASFYDTPSTHEIATFPPAKKAEPSSPAKKLEFESSITDLRVKRILDSQDSINSANASINGKVDKLYKKMSTSNVDLDDVFAPETVIRPNIPLYLLNQQLDEEFLLEERKRNRATKPMEMDKIVKEQTMRLKAAKEAGKRRPQQRLKRIQNQTPTPKKELYRSKLFDKEEEKKILNNSSKRRNPPKPEDKPKTPRNKSTTQSFARSKTPDSRRPKYYASSKTE